MCTTGHESLMQKGRQSWGHGTQRLDEWFCQKCSSALCLLLLRLSALLHDRAYITLLFVPNWRSLRFLRMKVMHALANGGHFHHSQPRAKVYHEQCRCIPGISLWSCSGPHSCRMHMYCMCMCLSAMQMDACHMLERCRIAKMITV